MTKSRPRGRDLRCPRSEDAGYTPGTRTQNLRIKSPMLYQLS